MKTLKMEFAVLAAVMLMIAGCVHLPITREQEEKPSDEAIAELTLLLEAIPHSWQYQKHVFDCSNMSAFLYDYLSQKGYKCRIMTSWKPLWRWHTWLVAEKKGKKFWIESTKKEIVCTHYFEWHFIAYSGSLEMIKKISKIIGFSDEWKY
ncbi:MAG: hypothetical protein Q8N42_00310 [bacterium]|nr:hypothetical protein [bacterium]